MERKDIDEHAFWYSRIEMASEAVKIKFLPYREIHGIQALSNSFVYTLYGQKDLDSSLALEKELKEFSQIFDLQPVPCYKDLKKQCFCIKANDMWLRARLKPCSAKSVFFDVFCLDIGCTKQVSSILSIHSINTFICLCLLILPYSGTY